MKDIKIFARTDVGMVRERNEDSYWVGEYDDLVVCLVADGMGGHIGGKTASELAVKTVQRLFNLNREKLEIKELIEDCLILTNHRIREKSQTDFGQMKIGTTFTLAAFKPPEECSSSDNKGILNVYFSHIGDSRIYAIQEDGIIQKTKDHTMLQRMIEAGILSQEEASSFSHKNIIYRSLDGSEPLEMDPVGLFTMEKNSVVLLCSDGLYNYITPEEMLLCLKATRNVKAMGNYLIKLANSRGGDDNITLIIVEYGLFHRDRSIRLDKIFGHSLRGKGRTVFSKKKQLGILILILFLLIFLLLMFFEKYQSKKKPKDVKNEKEVNDLVKELDNKNNVEELIIRMPSD